MLKHYCKINELKRETKFARVIIHFSSVKFISAGNYRMIGTCSKSFVHKAFHFRSFLPNTLSGLTLKRAAQCRAKSALCLPLSNCFHCSYFFDVCRSEIFNWTFIFKFLPHSPPAIQKTEASLQVMTPLPLLPDFSWS